MKPNDFNYLKGLFILSNENEEIPEKDKADLHWRFDLPLDRPIFNKITSISYALQSEKGKQGK